MDLKAVKINQSYIHQHPWAILKDDDVYYQDPGWTNDLATAKTYQTKSEAKEKIYELNFSKQDEYDLINKFPQTSYLWNELGADGIEQMIINIKNDFPILHDIAITMNEHYKIVNDMKATVHDMEIKIVELEDSLEKSDKEHQKEIDLIHNMYSRIITEIFIRGIKDVEDLIYETLPDTAILRIKINNDLALYPKEKDKVNCALDYTYVQD